ncbi:hypothetical protein DL764_003607 [Monosporascus ibericus]|uniref:Uncharacterized protein n=1 Tax=Monosporascus ibericus TaxID=155417 RepID=A0A4V1XBC3_9PEZI|nr:hypothetical protein DL764_003607 [Monosporascus ibericus]
MDDSSSRTPARQELDLDGPGMTPPSGVIPNFEDLVTGNNVALPVVTCCIVLVSIFSLVRFYTKSLNLKQTHIGDWQNGINLSYRLAATPVSSTH